MSVILAFLTSKLFALFGGGSLLGVGARILGYDRKAIGVAKKIPPKWWLAIAAVVLLIVGFFVHQHRAHAAIAAAKAQQKTADDAAWQAAFARERQAAALWKQAAEKRSALISQQERTRDEEAIRRNAAAADDLSVRGPGAATSHCGPVGHSGPGSGAGGHEPATPRPDVAGPPMPADDWALVPWSWLVQRAREHDDGTAENLAWRSNDARQRDASAKALSSPPK